jgi:alpha-L-fucosidase
MQERLVDIGQWLAINGEAIYGTHAWEAAPAPTSNLGPRLYYTAKGQDVYVLAPSWPTAPFVVAGARAGGHPTVTLLGSPVPVVCKQRRGQLLIQPPALTPAQIPSPLAYVFKVHYTSR